MLMKIYDGGITDIKGCTALLLPSAAWIFRLHKTHRLLEVMSHIGHHMPVSRTYHLEVPDCACMLQPIIKFCSIRTLLRYKARGKFSASDEVNGKYCYNCCNAKFWCRGPSTASDTTNGFFSSQVSAYFYLIYIKCSSLGMYLYVLINVESKLVQPIFHVRDTTMLIEKKTRNSLVVEAW